jgi:hypothetical protein
VSVAELGDLDTLAERVHAALIEAKSPICFVAMVRAWSRKVPSRGSKLNARSNQCRRFLSRTVSPSDTDLARATMRR